jgi:hypothetical protein
MEPASPHLRLAKALGSVILARLVAIGPDGDPWVLCEGQRCKPRRARTTIALGPALVGREVLVCLAGLKRVPVVVGVMLAPGDEPSEASAPTVDLVIDRKRIVFTAQQEVVLRCGKASIRLSSDGKVVVEGADVVSSARRVNRIRGGAVKIN